MKFNAQRITNLCYPKGSVVLAKFGKNSEYYFLNMRPLIVTSVQSQMFDTINVIVCGSRDRPGVEISLFSHLRGKWIGDHQYSVAQPYAIYTIMVSQIIEFHGVIDPFTMKAIDKAIAFHLGLTDEVPPYMRDIYDEMMAPRYSVGTNENTQLGDPHLMGSINESTRKFDTTWKSVVKDIGRPYPKPTDVTNTTFTNATYAANQIEPRYSYVAKETSVVNSNPTPETVEIPKVIEPPKAEAEPKRIGTANLTVPETAITKPAKEPVETEIDNTILNIALSMTDDERLKSIFRKLTPGKIGETKSVMVYSTQIAKVRKAIETTYVFNGKFKRKMKDRIVGRQSNFKFLSEFEKCCCILYCTPEELGVSEAIFNDVAKQTIKMQHLQFTDGRQWRDLSNFERLKKIYQGNSKKS